MELAWDRGVPGKDGVSISGREWCAFSKCTFQVQRDLRSACWWESDEARGHLDSRWLVEQDLEQCPVELFQNPSQQPSCPWSHVWLVSPSQWLFTMLIKCFIWPIHDFSGTPFKVLHRVLHGVGLHVLSSPLFFPKRELFLSVIEKCCRRCCWTAQVAQISRMPNKDVDSGMSISFENCRMLKESGKRQPTDCSKFVCSCHRKIPQNHY